MKKVGLFIPCSVLESGADLRTDAMLDLALFCVDDVGMRSRK